MFFKKKEWFSEWSLYAQKYIQIVVDEQEFIDEFASNLVAYSYRTMTQFVVSLKLKLDVLNEKEIENLEDKLRKMKPYEIQEVLKHISMYITIFFSEPNRAYIEGMYESAEEFQGLVLLRLQFTPEEIKLYDEIRKAIFEKVETGVSKHTRLLLEKIGLSSDAVLQVALKEVMDVNYDTMMKELNGA
jgi:hypothetical protein